MVGSSAATLPFALGHALGFCIATNDWTSNGDQIADGAH
jgi:hypothetical protein